MTPSFGLKFQIIKISKSNTQFFFQSLKNRIDWHYETVKAINVKKRIAKSELM